ncbi:unannotated protein [freshwater metagenome]|uniref:Unannotated protein n=1 Tax=freshwater metagenome TaxID=449393 RepID=A0A6J7H1G1_9ZZZZ
MGKFLQVRNLPDEVHETLTRRAKVAGMSLSEYVGRELTALANKDTMRDYLLRLDRIGLNIDVDPQTTVDFIRDDRDSR